MCYGVRLQNLGLKPYRVNVMRRLWAVPRSASDSAGRPWMRLLWSSLWSCTSRYTCTLDDIGMPFPTHHATSSAHSCPYTPGIHVPVSSSLRAFLSCMDTLCIIRAGRNGRGAILPVQQHLLTAPCLGQASLKRGAAVFLPFFEATIIIALLMLRHWT